ncbi:MAG TPA: DUF3341 domain-containing protein [Caulobacteraceae bacterium]|jgi:hypothetical protein|nr:DUF3341 domain-containing protein [Caulobacteraceae bacterium]
MSAVVVAEFSHEAGFVAAQAEARRQKVRIIDGYTPYPTPGAEDPSDPGPRRVTAAIAIWGFTTAILFYLLEWWSATSAYPFNSGARPYNSWPVFVLGPFEFGVFAAGFAGFIAFLIHCGLPRPHDAAFDLPGIERVSQDRFLLAFADADGVEAFAASLDGATVWRAAL